VFATEIWYNQEFGAATNIARLSVGEYMIDYINGIVYVQVSNTQNSNIGTVSYKIAHITPEFPHIISVDDIYYQISVLNPKNKQFSYVSFTDGAIIPEGLDVSDESFLNGVDSAPYEVYGGAVGAYIDATFIPGVTNEIKFIRGLYVYEDLLYSTSPINFSTVAISNNFNITIGSISGQSYENIQYDVADGRIYSLYI
jgi:hypothetical protein